MASSEYTRGYNAGYQAGRRRKASGAREPTILPERHGLNTPEGTYAYMMRRCPSRGGFMFEGARPAYERGDYIDEVITELLSRGWIVPHPDPGKGWVPVPQGDTP